MKKGRFITLEGGEGGGKSTQARLLADRLSSHGIKVLLTREPGGSTGAENIRQLLVSGSPDRWDPITELFLFMAARRDHLNRTILPALENGTWVISDRFHDSTISYQGYGLGIDLTIIETLRQIALGTFAPDLTFVLDLPVEEGLRRSSARHTDATRHEMMPTDFHARLRQGFLSIAKQDPKRCHIVDASRPVAIVQSYIYKAIEPFLAVAQ